MSASTTLILASWFAALGASSPALSVAVLTGGPATTRAAALAEASGGRAVGVGDLGTLDVKSLLVLLDARQVPGPVLEQVMSHLDRGGHLLVVGGPAFEVVLVPGPDGSWVTVEERLVDVATPHALVASEALNGSDLPMLATGLPSGRAGVQPESGGLRLSADFEGAAGWCSMTFPATPAPAVHNVIRVRGRLGGVADKLVVEIRERDGSRWLAPASPAGAGDEFVLHTHQFAFWSDSSSRGRGGEGDSLHLDQADMAAVGFASTHQPIGPGRHEVVVQAVETGSIDAAALQRPMTPMLEGLCPAYRTFLTTPVRVEGVGPLEALELGAAGEVVSPIARPMHPHPALETVWQPLAKGYDARGRWTCTPVSTTWRRDGATWTFVGYMPKTPVLAALASFLAAALPEGLPEPGVQGPLREPPATGARITVAGGRFLMDGEPWFAHGVNFWPLYVSGQSPVDYGTHWLTEQFYIPELVEMDLDLLREMGVNLVSVQYSKAEHAPQLRDFLARCHDRGIFANVFLGGAHPTDPSGSDDLDRREFPELLRAARLRDVPSVFGYDLAWEPALGGQDARARYDALFEAWVIEQYVSVARAEEVWGCPANRRPDGSVMGPTDGQIVQDGPHRVMMAAYRRFADDLISQRYRRVIELIRGQDDSHLVGARTGYGGTGTMSIASYMPYQLTSGACHLDFMSPEGWGYTDANIADAAFISYYARWAGNGKPVFWAEFGMNVWQGGSQAAEEQRRVYDAYRRMLKRTRSDGWAGWWFPGGYRVDERSDFGIVDPDRSLRPAAQLVADCAAELRDLQPVPEAEAPIVLHRDEHPAGLAFLVNDRRATFAEAWESGRCVEVRTPGTGTTSANCPFTGVGGAPFTAPQPPQYLNAEIVVLERLSAGEVRVEVINTGEATFLASDCGLLVRDPSGVEQVRPLPSDVPRFARVTMIVTAVPGSTVTVAAERFGAFGERARTP